MDYIRNDVAKQEETNNSIKSIELVNKNFFIGNSTAAIVTKMNDSTLLYAWGGNVSGQLGLGHKNDISIPTQVTFFNGKKIAQITLGRLHSAALLENGTLYTWGDNTYGQLGLGHKDEVSTPTEVTFFNLLPIAQIALGNGHSAALLKNGNLYTWGRNNLGQLGLSNKDETITPTEVSFFNGKKIAKIALSAYHSAALLKNGTLYTWGDNLNGQLGLGDSGIGTERFTPTEVTFFNRLPIAQISLGLYHSAVLLENGSLYTWGNNAFSQLGLDHKISKDTPTEVSFFNGKKIAKMALGDLHSAALLEDGSLYIWGGNSYGQLGLGHKDEVSTPTEVSFFNGKKITQIAFGQYHSAAMLEDGTLYTWGINSDGQLGLGNRTSRSAPTWMPYLGKDSHIIANDAITPKQVVDSFWVDGALNQVGFKNSFNLINIPDVADQEITMDTEPTYDDSTGTVTMKVKFKYFYDENGLAVADTSTTDMAISGFKHYSTLVESNTFPWWWILVGIGGAAIIGLIIWLLIKKNK